MSLTDLSQLQPGQRFALKDEKYQILSCFYRGTFSTVYKVLSEDGELHVMKVESKQGYNNTRAVLKLDVLLLRKLFGQRGFAQLREAARTEDWKLLIMSFCGPDLFQLQQLMPGGRFSLRTVLHIAFQTLDRLEVLHGIGWLHRDIKAGNLAVDGKNVIYLLDFGMARCFRQRNQREVGPYCGTFEFSSLASSYWQDMRPKDDLENWFYMVIHMLKGRLPWSGVSNHNLVRDMKAWAGKEKTIDVIGGLSPLWKDIYEIIVNAKPHMALIPVLRRKLREMIEAEKINMKEPLDWATTVALREVRIEVERKTVDCGNKKTVDPLGDGPTQEFDTQLVNI